MILKYLMKKQIYLYLILTWICSPIFGAEPASETSKDLKTAQQLLDFQHTSMVEIFSMLKNAVQDRQDFLVYGFKDRYKVYKETYEKTNQQIESQADLATFLSTVRKFEKTSIQDSLKKQIKEIADTANKRIKVHGGIFDSVNSLKHTKSLAAFEPHEHWLTDIKQLLSEYAADKTKICEEYKAKLDAKAKLDEPQPTLMGSKKPKEEFVPRLRRKDVIIADTTQTVVKKMETTFFTRDEIDKLEEEKLFSFNLAQSKGLELIPYITDWLHEGNNAIKIYPIPPHIGCVESYPVNKHGLPPLGGGHVVIQKDEALQFLFPKFNQAAAIEKLLYENPSPKGFPFKLGCVKIKCGQQEKISSCFIITEENKSQFWNVIHDCIYACLKELHPFLRVNGAITEEPQVSSPFKARLAMEDIRREGSDQRTYNIEQRYICSYGSLDVCLVFDIKLPSVGEKKQPSVTLHTMFPLVSKLAIKLNSGITDSWYERKSPDKETLQPEEIKATINNVIETLANYIFESLNNCATIKITELSTNGSGKYIWPDDKDQEPDAKPTALTESIFNFYSQGFPYLISLFQNLQSKGLVNFTNWESHHHLFPNKSLPRGDNAIIYLNENQEELVVTYMNNAGYYDVIIPIKCCNKSFQQALAYKIMLKYLTTNPADGVMNPPFSLKNMARYSDKASAAEKLASFKDKTASLMTEVCAYYSTLKPREISSKAPSK